MFISYDVSITQQNIIDCWYDHMKYKWWYVDCKWWIKTKSFNQIWIIDLKAHEVSSKEALEEDENIQVFKFDTFV